MMLSCRARDLRRMIRCSLQRCHVLAARHAACDDLAEALKTEEEMCAELVILSNTIKSAAAHEADFEGGPR